jgi:hypothetical protein
LSQDRALVLIDVGTAVDLKRTCLVVWDAVRLKSHIPTDLLTTLLHILKEQSFNHTLVNEKNVGVKDVDNRWIVDFATKSTKRFIRCATPESNIKNPDTLF